MLYISVLCVCVCVCVSKPVCACVQWIDRARQHYVTSMIDRPQGPMGRDCNSMSLLSQLSI